jgi:GH43 family beta-xylosidase
VPINNPLASDYRRMAMTHDQNQLSRRGFLAAGAAATVSPFMLGAGAARLRAAAPVNDTSATKTFFNPLIPDGADPWMVFHDGYYFLTRTTSRYVAVRRARSIVDLSAARDEVVWRDDTPGRSREMWAPEFYLLDGPSGRRWFLYYCASDGWHLNHRCHVLESTGDTPMGPYEYRGPLRADDDDTLYAIDAGLLVPGDGRRHVLWAGHPDHRIFIADTENPWTTKGRRSLLECDGFGCEEVREGPVTLVRNGKAFLIYSICDTGKPDYKLGMLIADAKSDLLRPQSWKQYPEPVFTRNDDAGVFGPGHNGFFTSPDGTEDWIIYHAKTTPAYTYRTRSPRAQKFTWRPDGTPDFGRPEPISAMLKVPSGDPGSSAGPRFDEPKDADRPAAKRG